VGARIFVHRRVLDQYGKPVPTTLADIWQANAGGRYRHKYDCYPTSLYPSFCDARSTLTYSNGRSMFRTSISAPFPLLFCPYPWRNGPNDWRPSHIHFSVSGPAIATRLITELYFEGDPLVPRCPIIRTLNEDAAQSLIAHLDMGMANPMDALAYRFDIVLRGQRQTHFENQ